MIELPTPPPTSTHHCSASSGQRPFLVPTTFYPDEGLLSGLVRASETNVFGSIKRLAQVIGVPWTQNAALPWHRPQFEAPIASLLSCPAEEVRLRTHTALEGSNVDWFGVRLPSRFVETNNLRFPSSGCTEYCRAIWQVKPLDFCPVSGERLWSTCPACLEEQKWSKVIHLGQCHECGSPLGRADEWPPVPRSAISAANLLSCDPAARDEVRRSLPEPFNSWDCGDVFRAIIELGLIAVSPIAPPNCKRFRAMFRGYFEGFDAQHLAAGFEFIAGWPNTFNSHVKKVTLGRSGPQRTVLGRLGKYCDFKAADTPLRHAIEQALPIALAQGDVPMKRFTRKGYIDERREGVLTLSECEERFGADWRILGRLRSSPKCLVAERTSASNPILFDATAVGAAILLWRGSVTHDDAGFELGVPPYAIEILVRDGLLTSVDDPDVALLASGKALVTTVSIERLRASVLGTASPASKQQPTLATATIGILHPESWGEIVRGLASGIIEHTAPNQSAPFFHEMQVDKSALTTISTADRRKSLPHLSVSASIGSVLLGVSNPRIGAAMKAGLIYGWRERQTLQIPLSQLRRFNKELALTSDLVREYGIAGARVPSLMEMANVEPVATLDKTMYWPRGQAESALKQLGIPRVS